MICVNQGIGEIVHHCKVFEIDQLAIFVELLCQVLPGLILLERDSHQGASESQTRNGKNSCKILRVLDGNSVVAVEEIKQEL